jgi:hypothetical protein
MMNFTMTTMLAFSQSVSGSINPELAEASPWLNEAVNISNGLMNTGIDPGLALATFAAVPVILKVLNMVNQFTQAAIIDWSEGRRLERERERLDLERAARDIVSGTDQRRTTSQRDMHPIGRVQP